MEKKYLLLGLMAILLANPASSQDCPSVEPTCDEMGYVNTAEECDGKQTVRCPFDTTKLFCGGASGSCPDGKIEVNELCYPNYDSCEDAGYYTTSQGCGTVKIYVKGEETTCYIHCCPDGYYKIDGNCRKTYANCHSAGYSDEDTGCETVVIYIDGNASLQKKICYNSKCCKATEVDDNGVCTPYYPSCAAAGAAQSPAKNLQSTANDCPVDPQYWIGVAPSNAEKTTCYDADCCEGADKCLYNNQCVTCYSSCSAYNSSFMDEAPNGYTCSSITIMIGAGNGATATSKDCYYDCTKDCSEEDQCMYNGQCVTCYKSCSDVDSSYVSAIPDGQNCISHDGQMIGSGYGAEITSLTTCYSDCSDIDPCPTDSSCCKYTHRVKNPSTRRWETVTENVTCYRNCQEVNSDYLDAEPENYSCSSNNFYIGSGYAGKASVTQCYYDCACSLTAATCAATKQVVNTDTCTCEDCPNNQVFDENGNFCRTCEGMQKEGTCAVGETFIEWSKYEDGSVCGTCISCKDETNKYNPCKGKYTCDGDGRLPIGETSCTCGTIPYYDKCGVKETCFVQEPYQGDVYEDEGGTCKGIQASGTYYFTRGGYYAVKKACSTVEGVTLYHMAYCSSTSKDCAGGYAPAAGLKICEEGGVGDPVECGGRKYYAECIEDPCQTTYASNTENGGVCNQAVLEGSYNDNRSGYYRVKERCTKTTGPKAGKTVWWIADCSQTEKDCAGGDAPAAGLKTCSAGGIGDPIECSGKKYYTECKEEDPCQVTFSSYTENGGVCNKSIYEGGAGDNSAGYYRVKEKCTKKSGTKVYWIAKCNVAKDCNGEIPDAAGLTECKGGEFGYGTIVQCGKQTFATTCLKTCNAEKTEADCTAEGKTFVFKCNDSNGKSWGECS